MGGLSFKRHFFINSVGDNPSQKHEPLKALIRREPLKALDEMINKLALIREKKAIAIRAVTNWIDKHCKTKTNGKQKMTDIRDVTNFIVTTATGEEIQVDVFEKSFFRTGW